MLIRFLCAAIVLAAAASPSWAKKKAPATPAPISKAGIDYVVDSKEPTKVSATDGQGRLQWTTNAVSGIPAKHKPTATIKKLAFAETEDRLQITVECKEAAFTVEIDMKTGKILSTTEMV